MKKAIMMVVLMTILALTIGCSKDDAAKKLGYVPESQLNQMTALYEAQKAETRKANQAVEVANTTIERQNLAGIGLLIGFAGVIGFAYRRRESLAKRVLAEKAKTDIKLES